MKIQYRKFEGPAMIAMGGGGGDKNGSRKNQTDFLGAIFVTRRGSWDDCDGVGGSVWLVGWQKS